MLVRAFKAVLWVGRHLCVLQFSLSDDSYYTFAVWLKEWTLLHSLTFLHSLGKPRNPSQLVFPLQQLPHAISCKDRCHMCCLCLFFFRLLLLLLSLCYYYSHLGWHLEAQMEIRPPTCRVLYKRARHHWPWGLSGWTGSVDKRWTNSSEKGIIQCNEEDYQ